MVAFTQATARKSKKQKEEEAAEQKRRQHELETSQVFEEYVADFAAVPRPKGSLGFVRAGESTLATRNVASKALGEEALVRLRVYIVGSNLIEMQFLESYGTGYTKA